MTPAPRAAFNRFRLSSGLIGLALLCGVASIANGQQTPPDKPVKPVSTTSFDDRSQSLRLPSKAGARNSMSRRWRDPSPADIKLFMLVAGDINPDWRDSLTALQVDDPEAFITAITANGRKLWQLVALREQKPVLYELRMEEIKGREKLKALGQEYRTALLEGWSAELVSVLFAKIEETARSQIDIQMRVRGEELAAMAEALEQLRNELLAEATDRVTRTQQLVELITAPPPDIDTSTPLSSSTHKRPGTGGQTDASDAGGDDATPDSAESPLG
jgi:hypothetical protein